MSSGLLLPQRRDDLVVKATGEGEYVVKLPTNGSYFQLGEVEHFLLAQLDGQSSPETVCQAFQQRFGEPLTPAEFDEFIAAIKPLGLLRGTEPDATAASQSDPDDEFETSSGSGNLLFYRRTLFNPDWLLNRLEPHLRFVWTRTFVALSSMAIVAAFIIVWNSRVDLVSTFPRAMRWESMVMCWVTMITVTMIHEMAHGLTCKHYGGEVREIGVLLVFFTPCFFCNVSDAWLIPKKSHRLWVTLAGAWCDLCLWSVAVFIWRVTVQDTLINYIAWIVISICGGRILFNFNPLLRLDGYYLLSDWLEIPNLRQKANEHWMGTVRWLLWGADRPAPHPRGGTLLAYGGLIWLFALAFLDFVIFGIFKFLGGHMGLPGLIITLALMSIAGRRVFRGFFSSEFAKMITTRPIRTSAWCVGTVVVLAVLFLVPVSYVANGDFDVRPGKLTEVHTPVSGFLKRVHHSEGDAVQPDTVIAELDLPDLCSQVTRKQAEVREVEATLKRLRTGPRPEEVAAQKDRVARTEAWRNLARKDLEQANLVLQQELVKLDQQIHQSQTDMNYTVNAVNRAAKLYNVGAIAGEQYRSEYKRYEMSASQLAQAKAARLARQAEGVRSAEGEVARRDKELEDARSLLSLLLAGSRPEEIEAETAKHHRLLEELKFLQGQQAKLKIVSPAAGVIATPRMNDRIGQLADLGALICLIEDTSTLNVEISVAEEDVLGVKPGQSIDLKVRALPFETFVAKVDRIAPRAVGAPDKRQSQNSVVVYCKVENKDRRLKSGMTGLARIYRGQRPMGWNLINQALRYIRTEFWW